YQGLDLSFKYPFDDYVLTDSCACIIDKLVQNREGHQGELDRTYAKHFLGLQKISDNQGLLQWKHDAPGVNYNSSLTNFEWLKGEYLSKTRKVTLELITQEPGKTYLAHQCKIIEELSKEHPGLSSSSRATETTRLIN
ncbi:MAG: hypothetical protein ACHP9Y_06440, partial [Gammaproteobacteria bacterium]